VGVTKKKNINIFWSNF